MRSDGRTDIGKKRVQNQDSIFFTDEPIGPLPNLYIVADGMGGHKAGDVASKTAIECVTEYIKESAINNSVSVLKRFCMPMTRYIKWQRKMRIGREWERPL